MLVSAVSSHRGIFFHFLGFMLRAMPFLKCLSDQLLSDYLFILQVVSKQKTNIF